MTNPNACFEKKKTTAPGRNFWKLSWMAESADGWRDEQLKLVLHDTDGLSIRRATYQIDPKVEHEVCPIETPSCRPDREKVKTVTLDTDNAGSYQIDVQPEGWDTVFWTESSIEKFLYPYYHAHRLWDQDMEDLKQAFEAYSGAFAIRHKAPSTSAIMWIEVGAYDFLQGTAGWFSVPAFIELARRNLAELGDAAHGTAGRGPDTRERGGAPSRSR